jgi:hypothetical protein
VDQLSRAIVYIVRNDSTIGTLTGTTPGPSSQAIVRRSQIGLLGDRAGIAYSLVGAPITGADNDNRLPRYRFECYGLDADTAWKLSNRLEAVLTANNLRDATPSVDAAPMIPEAVDASELEDGARKMARVDLTIEFDAMRE